MAVIGARIAANWLDPGWMKAFCEGLFTVSSSVILGVLLHGKRMLTGRYLALVPILAAVMAITFEVGQRWGWWAAVPLVVLTIVLIYRAARAGILGPIGTGDAPPVHPAESSR